MQKLKRLAGAYESMNNRWGVFVGYWIYAIVVIICIEVVARYGLNAPTTWANHLAQLIFGGFIVMGGAYTLLHGGHTRMDLIYRRLPSDRARAIVDVVTSMFFFLFCGALLYMAIPYCWQATLVDRRIHSWVWQAVEWPTLWCIPVACVLLLIQGIITFARDLRLAIRGKRQT